MPPYARRPRSSYFPTRPMTGMFGGGGRELLILEGASPDIDRDDDALRRRTRVKTASRSVWNGAELLQQVLPIIRLCDVVGGRPRRRERLVARGDVTRERRRAGHRLVREG